jgi:D-3-phosphoglycerate dehydrogenase
MYKVVITDFAYKAPDIEHSILDSLDVELVDAQCKDPQKLASLVSDADAVIVGFASINANVINAMQRARVIVRYGIGVDNVDLEAAAKKRIPVCNVPDYCIDEVADHTLSLILALTRQPFVHWDAIRKGEWKLMVPIEEVRALRDMTVGLVAFGRIARSVAARLLPFKCRVLVFDPVVDSASIRSAGCEPASFDELLAASDLLSLHCPSTPKTRGMIGAKQLAQMKKGSLFVNTSRGDLVKTADLIAALNSRHIAGAGLDVTDPEPVPKDSAFLSMSNVIMTPHMASGSVRAAYNLRASAAKAAASALRGEKLTGVVNGVT